MRWGTMIVGVMLAGCTATPAPRLVWEGQGASNTRSFAEAAARLRTIEPGRRGAAWGESADATFRLMRTTVAERPHVHDHHDLTIVMLRGTGRLVAADREHVVRAGDVLHVGRGRVHWFVPDPEEPVEAVAVFTPRLEGPDTRVIDPGDAAAPGVALPQVGAADAAPREADATGAAPRSR